MKYNKVIIICFGLMVILQLWTPTAMIWNRENVLRTGNAFKFRAAPVDPNDPFRGKYITLHFQQNSFTTKEKTKWESGETVYVQLTNDSAGYADIESLHKNQPAPGINFVKAKIDYTDFDSLTTVNIEWPFQRFYMEESKANDAEKAYSKSFADSNNVTYALVKVKNGDAALENVFINNIPIVSYLKR